MKSALRAEFRKLLTVRSTFGIAGTVLIIELFFAGFVHGYKFAGTAANSPLFLQDSMTTAVMLTAVLTSLVAVLIVTHEYRYNTILYTLTSNKRRLVLLIAKVIVITVYSLIVTALVAVSAPIFTLIGATLGGHDVVPQIIQYGDVVWRILFYGWGYSMLGLVIALLIRSQTGALVTMFVGPSILEGVLFLLLKENSVYLPFSVLGSVLQKSPVLSYAGAAAIFMLYVVIGWMVAWILFVRRNAN